MNGLEIGLKIRTLKGKDHLSFKNFSLSENEMEIKRKILLMKSYLERRKNISLVIKIYF